MYKMEQNFMFDQRIYGWKVLKEIDPPLETSIRKRIKPFVMKQNQLCSAIYNELVELQR